MAVIKKSPLEVFIESFVKQKSRFKIPFVYIDKAVTLIDEKIDPTCCDDPDGIVDVHTFRDNILTNTVRMYLNGMPKTAANLKSLERAKNKLLQFKDFCAFCE